MSGNDDRLKILKIKLNINMKGHQTIVYSPYMTIPGQSGNDIYFIPTIPLTRASISEAFEEINKKKPTTDDIAKIFFSKVDSLNIINKIVEIADQRGSPLFPLQFNKEEDILNGTITKTASGKFIFKQGEEKPIQLVPVSGSFEQQNKKIVNKMNVNFVRTKNYKYETRITVSNVSLNTRPYPENAVLFEFKNSVKPLTLDEAIEKGILLKNIKFLTNLLFNPNQTFFYKGQEKYDYGIYSYAVEKSSRNNERVWDIGPDGNTIAITVRLRLKPLVRDLEKGSVVKTQNLQGCNFLRADITRQFYEMGGYDLPGDIDSHGLVDDPEVTNLKQSSQFKISDRPNMHSMPQASNLPENSTLIPQQLRKSSSGGRKKTRRKHHRTNKYSRRYK
jgi:hypothetical protein